MQGKGPRGVGCRAVAVERAPKLNLPSTHLPTRTHAQPTKQLSYLIVIGAIAAWVPLVFEIAMLGTIFGLKIFYDHTAAGRRWVAAKSEQVAAAKSGASRSAASDGAAAGNGVAALNVSVA